MNAPTYPGLLITPLLLWLVACGGSDNKPDETIDKISPDTSTNTAVNGVAIDGYLSLAKACIDLNRNYRCDGALEYQTITDDEGKFTLSIPNNNINESPLLITTSAGITIDSDRPNQTINKPFFLLAPVNSANKNEQIVVSPFTTLVHAKLQTQSNDLTPDQALLSAEQEVLKQLKFTTNEQLYSDFIKAENESNLTQQQQKTIQRTKMQAQVLTDVMAKGLEASYNNAANGKEALVAKLFLEKFAKNSLELVTLHVDSAIAQGITEVATISDLVIETNPDLILTTVEVEQGYIEQTPAPTNGVVDDNLNIFSWAAVPGFYDAQDYEYSLNSGQSWHDVNNNLSITVGNIDLAIDSLQVRVKLGSNDEPGAVLTNSTAFYKQLAGASAPLLIAVNDQHKIDNVQWQFVTGFDDITDYEMSLNAGNSWLDATSPVVVGNIDLAANQIHIRVKAGARQDAGESLIISQAFTKYIIPDAAAAPTHVASNDINNTFTFALVDGFSSISNYEYQINQGSWTTTNGLTIQLEDKAYAIGSIKVRVKADAATSRPAGNTLTNPIAFTAKPTTPSAPTNGVVDDNLNTFSWSPVPNFTAASDYEYSLNSGTNWQDIVSSLKVDIGNVDLAVNALQVRVKAQGQREAGAVLTNNTAFYKQLVGASAPQLIAVNDQHKVDNVQWQFVTGFDDITDYEMSLNAGNSWLAATSPVTVGNIDLATNQIHIRVKASTHQDAGESLVISQAFTKYTIPDTPAAPTHEKSDDINNTFTFALVDGFSTLSSYEYQINQNPWITVTERTIQLEDKAYAIGSIRVRVKADTATSRPAGNALTNPIAFSAKPTTPSAPTNGVVDDNLNTFSWSSVPGFTAASDYEYSLNSGTNWQDVASSLKVDIGNADLAVNALQVRVKAQGQREAGAVLTNNTAFYKQLVGASAPQLIAVNDQHKVDNVQWQFVTGFDDITDYEMSLNAGNSWLAATSPVTVGNIDLAANQIHIRVKASTHQDAGESLVISQAFTKYTIPDTPAAPTHEKSDDINNTFTFALVDGFSTLSSYEYQINQNPWITVTERTIQLEDKAYAIGSIRVRVKADTATSRPAGNALTNPIAFTAKPTTPSAPTNGVVDDNLNTFTFTLNPKYSELNLYQYSINSGTNWQQVSANPITLTDADYVIGQIQVRVTENLTPGNNNAGEILTNNVAYTKGLTAGPSAPSSLELKDNNGLSWDIVSDYSEPKFYEYTNDKGVTWQQAVSNPQHIGHLAYNKEDVGIRVKEKANGKSNAAGDILWASSNSDSSYQFEIYPYTWRDQNGDIESLKLSGDWDKTETSCLIDHNAILPTFWVSISSVSSSNIDEEITNQLIKKSCTITDWKLIDLDELVTLSKSEVKSELADFSYSYNKFITKNNSSEVVFVQEGEKLPTVHSYYSGVMLLKWQYPGATAALSTITSLVSAIQTQNSDGESGYNLAKTPADTLITSYQNATSISEYLLINNDITTSQTSLKTGIDVINPQKAVNDESLKHALFLAKLIKSDPLANENQKQIATNSITDTTIAIEIQNHRISNLTDLQVQLTNITSILLNINSIITAQSELNQLTTSLTNFATSYPALLTALTSAQVGSEQHQQAKLLLDEWHQLMEKYLLATDKLNAYQSLLDMLPAGFHADALAELTLIHDNLISAQTPFTLNQLSADYQAAKQAFEDAYQSGYKISLDNAKIGTHFAKLDIAGHYIEANASFNQGWRCVIDLRYQDRKRVWALLNKGTIDSIDNVAYAGGSNKNLTESDGLLAQYNSDLICGLKDWNTPTINLLESLATTNNSQGELSIDPSVFPNHQGNIIDNYYYWSDQVASNSKHYTYQYNSLKSSYSKRSTADIGEDNYITIARLFNQKKQLLLDADGNETSDWDTAFCVKDSSGLIWQLPKNDDVNIRYNTVAKLTGVADDGGEETDNIPKLLNTAVSPLCGKTNWQLPTLAQLTQLYFYPLDKTYFQYWNIDSSDNNDINNYLSRDINSDKNVCLELDGDSTYCARKNYNGAPQYKYLYMMVSEPTKATPDAPTNGVVVDTADNNSFAWNNVTGFTSYSDYEYSINAGTNWKDATANPQNLADLNLATGDVQVRVTAKPLEYLPAGKILQSEQAYTSLINCTGYFYNQVCYSLVTEQKNHDSATSHCTAEGSELISKDATVDFNLMAAALSLQSGTNYWLKETDYWSYGYSLRDSSGWKPDNALKHPSTNQSFICKK